jgi:hypothetical protein
MSPDDDGTGWARQTERHATHRPLSVRFTYTRNWPISLMSLLDPMTSSLSREEAIAGLQGFSKQTANQVRLIHIPTNSLIAGMNTHVDDKPADSTAG